MKMLSSIDEAARTLPEQLLGHLAVARGTRKLEDDFPVPGKPEPGQSIDNSVYRRRCGSLPVGILDPQEHLAAIPAGVEPVEERGAGPADVQMARRAGWKANANRLGHKGFIVSPMVGSGP